MNKIKIFILLILPITFFSCRDENVSKERTITNTTIQLGTTRNGVINKETYDSIQSDSMIQDGTRVDCEDKSTYFIDKDIYISEIRWAVLYSRDNKLLTLDSTIIIYESDWVTKDSIEKWWEQ